MRHFLYFTVFFNCGSVEKNDILIPATHEIRPSNCVDKFFLLLGIDFGHCQFYTQFVGALLSRPTRKKGEF